MISLDSNLLLYAYNEDSPWHQASLAFVEGLGGSDDAAVSEFVLVEFYTLLRNPAVVRQPLTAAEAAAVMRSYRRHPRWALLGFNADGLPLHDDLWRMAAHKDFARRRIYDARLALSLRRHGVTEFATANLKDFGGFGFHRVWNPLEAHSGWRA